MSPEDEASDRLDRHALVLAVWLPAGFVALGLLHYGFGVGVWGAGRVGVRISPLNSYNDMKDSDPVALTSYVSAQLSERGIAFLHLMRGDFFGAQKADVVTPARAAFKGAIVGNMGYTPAEAAQAIADGTLAAVAFGHHYVSNPDLVARVRAGVALVEPDAKTFYSPGAPGYSDYPPMPAV